MFMCIMHAECTCVTDRNYSSQQLSKRFFHVSNLHELVNMEFTDFQWVHLLKYEWTVLFHLFVSSI